MGKKHITLRNILNDTANGVDRAHKLSITIFVISNIFLIDGWLYPITDSWHIAEWLKDLIVAVIDAGWYFLIFTGVKRGLDMAFIRKNQKYDVAGEWYHVHIPEMLGRLDPTRQKLSAGTTRISRNMYDFTFSGENHYYILMKERDTEIVVEDIGAHVTKWYSKVTKLSEENNFDLLELYKVEAGRAQMVDLQKCPCCNHKFSLPVQVREADVLRYGIHKYDFVTDESGRCVMISGEYSDCWPSLKSGRIYLYRTREERDARIREYFLAAKTVLPLEENIG